MQFELYGLINSLAFGRSGFNFKSDIFHLVLLIGIFRSSYDSALRWMSWDLPEDKSTMVEVMDWCCQATIHYLSQFWPRSLSPYGVTRPQWVKVNPEADYKNTVRNLRYKFLLKINKSFDLTSYFSNIANVAKVALKIRNDSLRLSHHQLRIAGWDFDSSIVTNVLKNEYW